MCFLACQNGDVAFVADNIPKIFWEGEFIGICGDGFWNNNNGASLFCKKLGYETGSITKIPGAGTTMKSLLIGSCTEDDTDLSTCKGGINNYTVQEYSTCTTGNTYDIVCTGGTSPKTISCEGEGIILKLSLIKVRVFP